MKQQAVKPPMTTEIAANVLGQILDQVSMNGPDRRLADEALAHLVSTASRAPQVGVRAVPSAQKEPKSKPAGPTAK